MRTAVYYVCIKRGDRLIKVYCNVDEYGNITDCLSGQNIVLPDNSDTTYTYDFEIDSTEIMLYPERYQVTDGELVRKEV